MAWLIALPCLLFLITLAAVASLRVFDLSWPELKRRHQRALYVLREIEKREAQRPEQ